MSHSSGSPPNYIDGVPVKISEKYKPPPKISLPQKIIQCLNSCQQQTNNSNTAVAYDFQLEQNVLAKISEWKNMRQQERYERRERIRQRQEERQKQVEERQKQMLTAVSYPNDLSSDEEEEVASSDATETISPIDGTAQPIATTDLPPTAYGRPTVNHFDAILMPTIIPGPDMQAYGYGGDHATAARGSHAAYHHSPVDVSNLNTNFSKINYSDFETDTSSPFDNVELKTINDLDILAQVLNLNTSSSSASTTPSSNVHSANQSIDIEITTITTTTTTTVTTTPQQYQQLNTTEEINIINENVTVTFNNSQPQHLQQFHMLQQPQMNQQLDNMSNSNDYTQQHQQSQQQQQQLFQIHPQMNYGVYNQPTNFNGQYASNYGPQYHEDTYYNYNGRTDMQPIQQPNVVPAQQTYYYNYNNHSNQNYAPAYAVYGNGGQTHEQQQHQYQPYDQSSSSGEHSSALVTPTSPLSVGQQKLKSKSVPDILKELNDELRDSEQKRTRNNSQSTSSPSDGKFRLLGWPIIHLPNSLLSTAAFPRHVLFLFDYHISTKPFLA